MFYKKELAESGSSAQAEEPAPANTILDNNAARTVRQNMFIRLLLFQKTGCLRTGARLGIDTIVEIPARFQQRNPRSVMSKEHGDYP